MLMSDGLSWWLTMIHSIPLKLQQISFLFKEWKSEVDNGEEKLNWRLYLEPCVF